MQPASLGSQLDRLFYDERSVLVPLDHVQLLAEVSELLPVLLELGNAFGHFVARKPTQSQVRMESVLGLLGKVVKDRVSLKLGTIVLI